MVIDPLKIKDRVQNPQSLTLVDTVLENVKSYNYLGVILHETVSIVKFMKEKCRRMNMRIHQLGEMRKYIDNWTANIFKQTIILLFDSIS